MTSHAVADETIDAGSAARSSTPVARAAPHGLSLSDHVTLFLIGLVVILVSLPRLRRFALRENETDAAHMLRVLWNESESQAVTLHPGVLGALFGPGTGLQNRSEDVEVLDDGRLRRHGYLFDVIETSRGGIFIGAWPWEYGRTGIGAFSIGGERGLCGNENVEGSFSGPDRPPSSAELADDRAWRSMSRF
jgi:hypothetical protein